MLLIVVVSGLVTPWPGSNVSALACAPSVDQTQVVTERRGAEIVELAVTLRATSPIQGGDKLSRVAFTSATNAAITVNGAPRSVPGSVDLAPPVALWTFTVRKVAAGQPFLASYAVTDLCGSITKFSGAGTGVGGSPDQPTPQPTAAATQTPGPSTTPTQPATATPVPTLPPTATPTATITATPVVARSPSRLSMFYHPPRDGTTIQTMVGTFASLVFTRGDEAYREQMRTLGFAGPAFQYLMANEASGPGGLRNSSDPCGAYLYYPNNVSGIAGDFCTALHPDEQNFLHNGRGERLYATQSWQESTGTKTVTIYMMNPAAPGWRAYLVQRATENLSSLGYSGIFLDNVDLSLFRARQQRLNSDGVVAEYSSDSTFRTAVVAYLYQLRAATSGSLWANMTGGSDSASDWDQYVPYLDGFMDEYFIARWSGTYASATVWENQLRRAESVLAQGKTFLGVAQGTQADLPRMRFAHASYLLIARDGAYFRHAHDSAYYDAWLYPEYEARLGNPTGPRYQSAGLWRRDFDCGHVTVDPASNVGTITVANDRPGCS